MATITPPAYLHGQIIEAHEYECAEPLADEFDAGESLLHVTDPVGCHRGLSGYDDDVRFEPVTVEPFG